MTDAADGPPPLYPGAWARIDPDKPAAIRTDTGERLTFRQLDDRSNQLAQHLHALGLRVEGGICVLLDNDLRYFEAAWAALRSGLRITPVNHHLTPEEAAYIINDSGATAVVTGTGVRSAAAGLPEMCPNVTSWLAINGEGEAPLGPGFDDYEDALAAQPAQPLEHEPAGGILFYSSGTTGKPKGIVRPLREGTVAEIGHPAGRMQETMFGIDRDAVYLSPAPLYHSAPLGFCLGSQSNGATVVVMPRFDALEALGAIETHRVTHSQWVPTMFSRMLKLDEADRTRFDLSSHQVAIHAAAPCPKAVKQDMFDWWGPIIHEYYGASEFMGMTHVTPEAWLAKPGTVGIAVLGIPHICDDDGNELPPGEPGLIYFENPNSNFSYLGDDAKTADAHHPHQPTWSGVGDVGYLDEDGYLFLTDRATFMIISGGVNIYPQEIEDALIVHPKVEDAAVIGVPNAEMGEEVKGIVQLIEGVEPGPEVEAELLAYCQDQIARYKCPRSIDFEDELPRLPTGKLYKRLLKDRYWGTSDSRIV